MANESLGGKQHNIALLKKRVLYTRMGLKVLVTFVAAAALFQIAGRALCFLGLAGFFCNLVNCS